MPGKIVHLTEVIADSRCQSRTGIDPALVQEYADHLKEGAELPPLCTIDDDGSHYLYDGFHRIEAYQRVGATQVAVTADPGDIWDAIERSCRVNTTHGKRRAPADTKRAVEMILEVMRHRGEKWSQVEIAERCALSQQRVSQLLSETPSYKDLYDSEPDAPTTVTRNGTTYPMDTTKIGRRRAPTLNPGPDIDEETGEVRDEADDEIDAEEVDPNDIATYQWEAAPSSKQMTAQPVRDFDPEPIALRLVQELLVHHSSFEAVDILEAALVVIDEDHNE